MKTKVSELEFEGQLLVVQTVAMKDSLFINVSQDELRMGHLALSMPTEYVRRRNRGQSAAHSADHADGALRGPSGDY
jgi:hypothetical protein